MKFKTSEYFIIQIDVNPEQTKKKVWKRALTLDNDLWIMV